MAVVRIPSLIRDLTGGKDSVEVPGSTLRQVINNLDRQYPGIKARLLDGDRLNPQITVAIDGALISMGLLEPVEEGSEVSIIPRISGG